MTAKKTIDDFNGWAIASKVCQDNTMFAAIATKVQSMTAKETIDNIKDGAIASKVCLSDIKCAAIALKVCADTQKNLPPTTKVRQQTGKVGLDTTKV